jgi:hypothetical protein
VKTLESQIQTLADALQDGADLIPLQRRVRRSSPAIAEILETGITTRALAEKLAGHGVTGKGGTPITHGHLRVLLARARADTARTPAPLFMPQTTPPSGPLLVGSQPGALSSPTKTVRPDFSSGLFAKEERDHMKREK